MKFKKFMQLGILYTGIRMMKTLCCDENRNHFNEVVNERCEKYGLPTDVIKVITIPVMALVLILTWPIWILIKINDD